MNTATQTIPAGGLEKTAELGSILQLLVHAAAYPDNYYTPAVARCVELAEAITEAMDHLRGEGSVEASATAHRLLALMKTILTNHFDVMANGDWDAECDRLIWLYSLGAHLAEECESHLASRGALAGGKPGVDEVFRPLAGGTPGGES